MAERIDPRTLTADDCPVCGGHVLAFILGEVGVLRCVGASDTRFGKGCGVKFEPVGLGCQEAVDRWNNGLRTEKN